MSGNLGWQNHEIFAATVPKGIFDKIEMTPFSANIVAMNGIPMLG
jgi:hypothetical protein